MSRRKDRDLSLVEYLEQLQKEYVYFEFKKKIYPNPEDVQHFQNVMDAKENKIRDISERNRLETIFTSEEKLDFLRRDFFKENGLPKRLGKRDWYFYYQLNGDFNFNGDVVKLLRYDLELKHALILYQGEEILVDIEKIFRIL